MHPRTHQVITRDTLEDISGTTAFHRGEEYLAVGAVSRLRATEEKITARVEGTETYLLDGVTRASAE